MPSITKDAEWDSLALAQGMQYPFEHVAPHAPRDMGKYGHSPDRGDWKDSKRSMCTLLKQGGKEHAGKPMENKKCFSTSGEMLSKPCKH